LETQTHVLIKPRNTNP